MCRDEDRRRSAAAVDRNPRAAGFRWKDVDRNPRAAELPSTAVDRNPTVAALRRGGEFDPERKAWKEICAREILLRFTSSLEEIFLRYIYSLIRIFP